MVERVRLTRKTRPGARILSKPEPGLPTPKRWKRLNSVASSGLVCEPTSFLALGVVEYPPGGTGGVVPPGQSGRRGQCADTAPTSPRPLPHPPLPSSLPSTDPCDYKLLLVVFLNSTHLGCFLIQHDLIRLRCVFLHFVIIFIGFQLDFTYVHMSIFFVGSNAYLTPLLCLTQPHDNSRTTHHQLHELAL